MIFSPHELQQIKQKLSQMKEPVKILFFNGHTKECEHCSQIEALLRDLHQIESRIVYETHNYKSEIAKKLRVSSAPVLLFEKKPNIRFLGAPLGYEFAIFLEDIIAISQNSITMPLNLAKEISKIGKKVRIMVFVTPTCPYCPIAVKTAHQFAFLNQNIVAEMIESLEYAELANKWNVFAVPKIVINEKIEFEGAQPPALFLQKIKEAI